MGAVHARQIFFMPYRTGGERGSYFKNLPDPTEIVARDTPR